MQTIPFKIEHIHQIELQPYQAQWQQEINAAQFKEVMDNSYTIIANDEIILIGGVYKIWENRIAAWSLISKNAGKHFVGLIRTIQKQLSHYKGYRVECYVEPVFAQGHRFAKLIGFECEAPLMRKFHQNGTDASMYAMFIDL